MNPEQKQAPLVSIITATIGRDHLARCIKSVKQQTYPNIQHFVVIDGKEHEMNARKVLSQFGEDGQLNGLDVLCLPYPTRAFGGRIYASSPHLTRGDFIINLDDDNYIEPNHVQSLVDAIGDRPWAYTLRNLTRNGVFVVRDDCLSLGPLHPIWNTTERAETESFVDTNCYLFRRSTAIELCQNWASVPFNDNPYQNDVRFYNALLRRCPEHSCTLSHTLNYEMVLETHWEYVNNGNKWMHDQYGADLPWRSAKIASSFRHHGIFETESRDGLYFDESLANAILALYPVRPTSVADVGCGPGYYCAHFAKHANWDVQGYEGNPKAKAFGMWHRIKHADLSLRNLALPAYELVLSLEVGEHIPKAFEGNFLDNLSLMTGKTIILSWAVKGQGGTGHFNEQNNPYIISNMEARGFRFNSNASNYLRNTSSLPWFKNTIMVFDRIEYENPTAENCISLSAAFYNSSQFENSIAAARKALTLKPDLAVAYNNICAANNQLGNFSEGKKAGEQAVRLDPNNQLAKNNLAWSIRQLNKK